MNGDGRKYNEKRISVSDPFTRVLPLLDVPDPRNVCASFCDDHSGTSRVLVPTSFSTGRLPVSEGRGLAPRRLRPGTAAVREGTQPGSRPPAVEFPRCGPRHLFQGPAQPVRGQLE